VPLSTVVGRGSRRAADNFFPTLSRAGFEPHRADSIVEDVANFGNAKPVRWYPRGVARIRRGHNLEEKDTISAPRSSPYHDGQWHTLVS